jgi:sulfite reductase (NADPH) hemoprotein beta-component
MSGPAKVRAATHPVAITANDLADGRVVWLASGGPWTRSLASARVFGPEEAHAALATAQEAERARHVVGAYAVEVAVIAGVPRPLRLRERLRAAGPSVDAAPHPALPLAS